jgi:hypothetical protein
MKNRQIIVLSTDLERLVSVIILSHVLSLDLT